MNSKEYTRIKEIFAKATALPAGERIAFLNQAAGGDEELRREIEALLRHHDEPTSTVPSSAFKKAEAASSHAHGRPAPRLPLHPRMPERLPKRIGTYRVVREIGRGGMGMVYLGVREEGRFQKRVAIKVIKKGMDSEDVLRRFELERQLLSALNHPNIARLYDGGTTEDGRPYFALEYVEGMHLDQYADRHKLTIDERLKLFKQVCSAVTYAHRNLVVHRDIKPANILVTDDGTVKLMDFGIAKLLNPELSLIAGDPTAKDLRVMTPEYASPEQVRGERISTASDVYSLGVLLYEMLTGHRPYRIKERVRSEIERVICEQEPEKPSTAISKIEEIVDRASSSGGETPGPSSTRTLTPESVSATRGSKPDALRRRLAGDIDNIILMAMRKEPMRRYTSVERFAEDIERHLDGRPITARPASFVYRSSKFVRRNKAGVALAALVVLSTSALVGFGYAAQSASANWALRESEKARADAEHARRAEAEALAEKRAAQAERRAMSVRDLAKILLNDFNQAIEQLEGATKARELLVTTALAYLQDIAADQDTGDDPLLMLELARAYEQVGNIQGGIRGASVGDVGFAIDSYTRALELRQAASDYFQDDAVFLRDRVHAFKNIGDAYGRAGHTKAQADAYREQLALVEEIIAARPDNIGFRHIRARALLDVGGSLVTFGDHHGAMEHYRRALDELVAVKRMRPAPVVDRDITVAHTYLASRHRAACEVDQALDFAHRVLQERQATMHAVHEREPTNARVRRDTALAHRHLGTIYMDMGDLACAIEQFTADRDHMEHGVEHSPNDARIRRDRAAAYGTLGDVHFRTGRLDDAIKSYRVFHAHITVEAQWDEQDAIVQRYLAQSHEGLGRALAVRGPYPEAIRHYRDAVEITSAIRERSPDDVSRQEELARQQAGLAKALTRTNMLTEAATLLTQSRSIYEDLLKQQPENCHHRKALVGVIAQQANLAALRGDVNDCLELAHHGLELGLSVPEVTAPLHRAKSLGLRLQGRPQEADQALQDALAVLESRSHLDVEQARLRDTIHAELRR